MIKPKILIIDDNGIFVDNLSFLLQNDFDCSGVYTAEDGISILSENHFDVILLDIKLGSGLDGIEFLEKIHKQQIFIPTIMITGDKSIDMVVKAMKAGAYDYVGKDPDLSELKIIINRALNEFGLRRENELLREEIQQLKGQFVGESPAIRSIRQQIQKLAPLDSTVLISGDSGTGKEVVARNIHQLSKRKNKPFITLNCAAIPKELFESEFFGHEKGAFTGADQYRKGMIEDASGGTVFLDEIGDLSVASQVKLLRLLESGEYNPLGSDIYKKMDVRVIAATNRNLQKLMNEGLFRKDLYYRLSTYHIHIPPLRERLDDLPLLIDHFLKEISIELGKKKPTPPPELYTLLETYHFPGNIRELKSMMFDAISRHKSGILSLKSFKEATGQREKKLPPTNTKVPVTFSERLPTLNQVSWILIDEAMKRAKGNKSIAARLLGVTPQALSKRLIRGRN